MALLWLWIGSADSDELLLGSKLCDAGLFGIEEEEYEYDDDDAVLK